MAEVNLGYNMIYIIAIDPGTNLGISIYGLNEYNFEIISIETTLVILDNQVDPEDKPNKLLNKLMVINNICEKLYNKYSPIAIIEEAAFVSRFPKAVMQLSQYIAAIELTFKKLNNNIKFYRYPPKYIKKEILAGGSANKNDITIAISNIPEITRFINPFLISEHEVDALAIGYIGLQEIRNFPYTLFT